VLAAHFPQASVGADQLLLRYAVPVWDHPFVLTKAQAQLAASPVFASVSGPLGPGRGALPAGRLAALHQALGPAARFPLRRPPPAAWSPALYQAYRATAQFISPDGRTCPVLRGAGRGPGRQPRGRPPRSPRHRPPWTRPPPATGAQAHGVAGQDASAHDILSASTTSLQW